MTVSHGDRDDRYPFMNQKRSTGVAQITGTDPFDISDAHHEMRSHIIYSIDAFTLRQLSCPVLVKMFFGAEWMRFRLVLRNDFAGVHRQEHYPSPETNLPKTIGS